MSRADAERPPRQRFGNVTHAREETRAQPVHPARLPWPGSRDRAARTLRKSQVSQLRPL